MKTMNLKSYGPALALALIIAVSAPFMRPVQSQTLADRLNKINAERPVRREVVLLAIGSYGHGVDTNGVHYYQSDGFKVEVSSSSAGAPTFPQETIPLQLPLADAAEAIAQLLSAGYTQVSSVNNWPLMFVK